jgi:hypothetical protein
MSCPAPQPVTSESLARLIYELLDADEGTVCLAGDLANNRWWHAHLFYLRDLQHAGRETLGRLTAFDVGAQPTVNALCLPDRRRRAERAARILRRLRLRDRPRRSFAVR